MRSLLDTEEEEKKAAEITLSTASLLGIFFGLVLICGVFFGFGYSMGRGTGQGGQAASLGNEPASSATEPEQAATENTPPAAPAAEPQEAAPAPEKPVVIAHTKVNDPPAPSKTVEDAAVVEEATAPVPIKKPAPAQPPTVAATTAPAASPAPGTGQPMVQIAAVARREDADVLVSALRQRGYGVVVRNEPQDKLLHVQVGPFADRVQATAIKQKLLSDGYNAIIKQ
jgi:DedD protein